MCVPIYIYRRICAFILAYMCVQDIYIYIYIYIHMCVCVCMYQYIHIFICVCVCVCMCVCVCVCVHLCIYAYIRECIYIVVVEGDPKVPFSIATTPRCKGRCYFFPWIAELYPRYVHYNAECWARRYQVHFLKVFGMTRPGIEPWSPGPLVNTLPVL